MFAIAFDMKIEDLKKHYGDPYNGAYKEIEGENLTLWGLNGRREACI